MIPLSKELGISVHELLSGQRLDDEDFRRKADEQIVLSLQQVKSIRRAKKISDMLYGAGTGILISTIYAPDTTRKIITVALGLMLLCLGQYKRGKSEQFLADH